MDCSEKVSPDVIYNALISPFVCPKDAFSPKVLKSTHSDEQITIVELSILLLCLVEI